MKILHTADWHIGKWLDRFSRLPEQREVLKEICEIADREAVDMILVAGDVFDTFNPSAESMELFFQTVKTLGKNGTRAVVVIAGNHDQPERIESSETIARTHGVLLSGLPETIIQPLIIPNGIAVLQSAPGFLELQLPGTSFPVRVLLTPYANEYRLKTFLGSEEREDQLRDLLAQKWKALADTYCDDFGVNLLCAHLFFQQAGKQAEAEPEDERPILHVGGAQAIYSANIPPQIQYVALGHLHRYQEIDSNPCPVVYSSSPLSYSFAEADQKKYVVIIEAEPAKPLSYRPVPLASGKPLLRKRFTSPDDATEWLKQNPDTLVELTLVTTDFLSAEQRKQLQDIHDGIVTIIPEITHPNDQPDRLPTAIDLNQSMEAVFTDYFISRKNIPPDASILEVFREVLGESEETP